MSNINESQVGGFFGSTGWYRATGESVIAADGSIAWKYTNPYTWFDGCDRNEGNEIVMWAVELRAPLTVAPIARGLFVVPQPALISQPTVPSKPGTPTVDPVIPSTDQGGGGGGG